MQTAFMFSNPHVQKPIVDTSTTHAVLNEAIGQATLKEIEACNFLL
ncbi:hypothetical protein RHODOSMS8_02440 [Rhodobiaceae bacterium]|nr:hypothetical protein RHODOSMS8_02440 [Rhodobiaceae bacterium]